VRGRLGEPLRQLELFGMQNTLEGYVAEGLAVSLLLVVYGREVRFYNRGTTNDCRESSAELLKANETVRTYGPRVFETKLAELPRFYNSSLGGSSHSQPFSKISESQTFDLSQLRPRHGKHANNQVIRNRCVSLEAERSLPHAMRAEGAHKTNTEKNTVPWHHLENATTTSCLPKSDLELTCLSLGKAFDEENTF
jgi:hypothetical protein